MAIQRWFSTVFGIVGTLESTDAKIVQYTSYAANAGRFVIFPTIVARSNVSMQMPTINAH